MKRLFLPIIAILAFALCVAFAGDLVGELPPIKAVDVPVDQQGMSRNLYMAFPKSLEGAHTITEADRSVDFLLKTPNIEIKARFSLKDMLYQDKLEL